MQRTIGRKLVDNMDKTTKEIADGLSVEKHRVKYAIQKLELEKSGESAGAFLYDEKDQEKISEFIQQLDGDNSETNPEENPSENELEIVRVQSERIEDLKSEIEYLRDALESSNENLKHAQSNLERQQMLNVSDRNKLLAYEEAEEENDENSRRWWQFWK